MSSSVSSQPKRQYNRKPKPPVQSTVQNVEQTTVQSVQQNVEQTVQNVEQSVPSDSLLKSTVTKTGRTLLVSSDNTLNESMFTGMTGLTSHFSTKNSSFFLTFDTVDNSTLAYAKLHSEHPNLRVKFARYQLFFTLTGLTDSSDYNAVKQDFTTFVESNTGSSLLFFKLYRKSDKYIGCGDLTVDTKAAMDLLLNKNDKFNSFTLGNMTGSFFRFNKQNQSSPRHHVSNSN
jgi:hypothetical protein